LSLRELANINVNNGYALHSISCTKLDIGLMSVPILTFWPQNDTVCQAFYCADFLSTRSSAYLQSQQMFLLARVSRIGLYT